MKLSKTFDYRRNIQFSEAFSLGVLQHPLISLLKSSETMLCVRPHDFSWGQYQSNICFSFEKMRVLSAGVGVMLGWPLRASIVAFWVSVRFSGM